MDIEFDLIDPEQRKQKPDNISTVQFGTTFTDHMLTMRYRNGSWHSPLIVPYQPLSIDPAALVLHYGQGIFEGLKAYRRGTDVFLLRPENNVERFKLTNGPLAGHSRTSFIFHGF